MVDMLAKPQQHQQYMMQKFMGDVLKKITETPRSDPRAEARRAIASEEAGSRGAGQHPVPTRAHAPGPSAFAEPSPFVAGVSSGSERPSAAAMWGQPAESLAFLKRYLRLTHCDLFFADAAILVEGAVEVQKREKTCERQLTYLIRVTNSLFSYGLPSGQAKLSLLRKK